MLVQPDTAAAGFHIKRTQDVDIQASNLASWEQHYEQTSPGTFRGEVRELTDQGLQVFEEAANCATSQRCCPRQGGIWIGLAVTESHHGLRFMGRPSHGLQLMLAGGEQPFDLQVPAHHGLYGVVLGEAQLASHVQALHQQPWPASRSGAPRVHAIGPLQRYRLTGLVREVLRCLQEQPKALHHEASRRSLREAVLTTLCDVVLPQTLSEAVSPRQLRRQELVHRVRELAFAHPEQPLSVKESRARMHMTRRTLQNSFQESLGISPATYLRTVRLNAVRRALGEGDALATIADIAARSGFWHMGHFSHDYKALFGETPSQTRQLD
jgi:AraC family ethanolamine operon transcriptional activator